MDSATWDERYRGSELLWARIRNRFLIVETPNSDPGTALELACGDGRNAMWLADGDGG
jgi:hypothetical protein